MFFSNNEIMYLLCSNHATYEVLYILRRKRGRRGEGCVAGAHIIQPTCQDAILLVILLNVIITELNMQLVIKLSLNCVFH